MAISERGMGIKRYTKKTPKSLEFYKEACKVMPGGTTANIKFFAPYPIVMDKGKGSRLYDLDGNEYIDYLLSYGALILGHGHPRVLQAVQEQLYDNGTYLFGTPHLLEVEMGRKIQQLYPGVELLRFTNSGTEATLLAIRLAYAYTGKNKIAKFEGHYHGGYDQVLVSVNPSIDEAGHPHQPRSVAESKGMDQYHEEHTVILPFNDLDAASDILRKRKDELAAVIVEPIQGGYIPAERSFMEGLRKLTEELDILLVFDEVKTCFRLGLGGAQEYYSIKPDLTALGKAVGGGYPIGITGGKKDIMEVSLPKAASDVFDSSQSKHSNARDVLFHSGTYNGHPSILAAGLETIAVLEEEISQINETADRLKTEISKLFLQRGIAVRTLGIGSIFNLIFTEKEQILNYRDLQSADFGLRRELDFQLINEGIYTKPLNRYSVSSAHGQEEIDQTLEAYDKVIKRL
ncbi:aspartate aminotransferase family protein [Siminovitchia fortis]|uniref:Aspartate aminotransferase family protein n=1 Tax=Siminovitchia fortis TaxID=254758 RepID=A0A443IM42_9BACI|nr:aspartate aminotransferase family protein [Siminovitchia fortis]RWR06114.1 aspartate aminotransferase family protein [Siminovitchia fortis]WHY81547.1 aspartate aminotransferase family protein [Siminovitchia fortis]